MDVHTISPELLNVTFPEGIYLFLASPPVLATQVSKSNREHTPPGPDISRHIIRFVLHLSESQSKAVVYIWNSSELHLPYANTLSLLGLGTLLTYSTPRNVARESTVTQVSGKTFCPKTPWRHITPASIQQPDRLKRSWRQRDSLC